MKKAKLASILTAAVAPFVLSTPAHAANPDKDFAFSYNVSHLQTVEGREGVKKSLMIEAHDFCRRHTYAPRALRMERKCRQTVISESLQQIAEKNPDVSALLVREATSYDRREHRTGRPRR